MDWGEDYLSDDFYKPIPTVATNTKWYECVYCGADLRSGKHNSGCNEPDSSFTEVERVSFVLRQMHKNRGLTVLNGGKK